MKRNHSTLLIFLLMIVVGALYRIVPGRMPGFAPQIAMALFAGAVVKDRKWSFAFPLLSMFLSDLLFEALYKAGVSVMPGFYEGQWQNYLLFVGLTMMGWMIRRKSPFNMVATFLAAPTAYFLASNFLVWVSGGGYAYPKTIAGLIQTYEVAIPFYQGSLLGTAFFGGVLFGGYYLLQKQKGTSAELA